MEEYNYNILVGNVVTAIFMIIACYFGTIKFHQTQAGVCKPVSMDDFIPVGYIEDAATPICRTEPTKPVQINKPTTHRTIKPKPKTVKRKTEIPRNTDGFTELQQDCYDALKGLKVTAKEAKYLVHSIFNKHNPKTIQDFLQLAFVRG
jgi:hypothetical protein